MIRTRLTLARSFLTFLLLIGVAAGSGAGRASAAAVAVKTYTSTANHYALRYPATWTLTTGVNSAKTLGNVEASISATAIQIVAPTHLAQLVVLVKAASSDAAAIKSKETALLQEDSALIGTITFGTLKQHGLTFITATATDKLDTKHTAKGTITAVSHGHFTYYLLSAYVEKQASTTQEAAALVSIIAGFTVR